MLVLVLAMLAVGCAGPAGDSPALPDTTPASLVPLSDKELAEKTIANTEEKIQQVNKIIEWFRGNTSTSNDNQLAAIVAKREFGVTYLSNAKDDYANGDYPAARNSSEIAYAKVNESYHDALERQRTIHGGNGSPPPVSFDYILFSVLLIGLIPLLLTAVLYSLMQKSSSPLMKLLFQFMGPGSGFAVFVCAWIVYPLLIIGAIIIPVLKIVGFGVTSLWAGLIIGLVILSVMAIGIEVSALPGYVRKKRSGISDTNGDSSRLRIEKIAVVVKIELMILLLLFMPLVISRGLTIFHPVVNY
jgi:hypothetical protein